MGSGLGVRVGSAVGISVGSGSAVGVGSDVGSGVGSDVGFGGTCEAMEANLLQRVMGRTPGLFDQLVVDLLMKMWYGGSNTCEAGRRVGRSGDGIDGVIDEDCLGLDAVYIQAKRWAGDRPVRRPNLQGFAGNLEGQRASKGVFIPRRGSPTTRPSTSNASRGASA